MFENPVAKKMAVTNSRTTKLLVNMGLSYLLKKTDGVIFVIDEKEWPFI